MCPHQACCVGFRKGEEGEAMEHKPLLKCDNV